MKSLYKLLIIFPLIIISTKPFTINQYEALSLKKKGISIKNPYTSKFLKLTKKKVTAFKIDTNPITLQKAAKYSLELLKDKKNTKNRIINTKKVKETLRFIIALIENDKKNKRPFRILNTNFLNKYFKFIRWSGDIQNAKKHGKIIKPGSIYLTHYATFEINGNYKQTKKYPYALYQIINKYFDQDLRFKISKQNVLRGRLNLPIYKNKVKPLVWVTRQGLEEALMQGTTIVKMPNGKKRIFCVNKNNGFAYDQNIKKRENQKRYWYFKELKNNNFNIINLGKTVFAGDIYNIGLGKIIAIRYKNRINKKIEMRLGILADSGGAFVNNLYQLDYYGGAFKNHKDFYSWVKPMPRNVQSFILIKK
ncbi:hypothetical protein GF385_02335 [Candidatus Dependentiae bacterium]|nr:hypothetical protein [Candidatus Dependentiae bacterium]